MLRRLSIASVVVATALICTFADSRTCQAQGLLRRIRSRIQSRIEPSPPVPLPRQAPSAQKRVQPERARPVAPSVTPNPASKKSRKTSTAPSSTLHKSRPLPVAGSQSATVDANKFGSSILVPSQPDPSQRVDPQRAVTGPEKVGRIRSRRIASTDRPSLGIQVLQSRDQTPGLKVAGIRADSLADDAGLKVGDLIVAIDGKPTPNIADVARYIDGLRSGDRVRAKIVRGRTTADIVIPLVGKRAAPADPFARSEPVADAEPVAGGEPVAAAEPTSGSPSGQTLPNAPIDLGIQVETPRGVRGVVVSSVTADSVAAAAGLQVGDRIVSIDGRLVISGDAFNRELTKKSSSEPLVLQLVRDGNLIAADLHWSDRGGLAKTETPKTQNATDNNGSVLEGIGSILGGLLGGKKPDPKAGSPSKADTMAFGDKEQIEQVTFESEVKPAEKKLQGDPPSLEALELPPGQAKPIELDAPKKTPAAKKTIERLRDEVRRLEAQLKELEASE